MGRSPQVPRARATLLIYYLTVGAGGIEWRASPVVTGHHRSA